MDDGTQIQEVPEIPQEVQEVSEIIQQVDQAAFEPEAALEENDYNPAEELQEAVTEVIDAAPTLEAPPPITLEGAGAEGKVTITEAAEPAAIIDTNDGSSTVTTGPDMSDVAIIDSNDGISKVADPVKIIDSNDGSAQPAEADTPDSETPGPPPLS